METKSERVDIQVAPGKFDWLHMQLSLTRNPNHQGSFYSLILELNYHRAIVPIGAKLLIKTTDNVIIELTNNRDPRPSYLKAIPSELQGYIEYVSLYRSLDIGGVFNAPSYPITEEQLALLSNGVVKIRYQHSQGVGEMFFKDPSEWGNAIASLKNDFHKKIEDAAYQHHLNTLKDIYEGF